MKIVSAHRSVSMADTISRDFLKLGFIYERDIGELDNNMADPLKDAAKFTVKGHRRNRKIKCHYCKKAVSWSIVPHLREYHQRKWKRWVIIMAKLYNDGNTPKQIMRKFGTLFTWKVIENELMRLSEGNTIKISAHKKGRFQGWGPMKMSRQKSTMWSYPVRGTWAVHQGDYRGNWAPQIPRSLVLQYTKRDDKILDPFVGGGTTLIECWLWGRKSIGVDISPHAIRVTNQRLKEMKQLARLYKPPKGFKFRNMPKVIQGDAKDLSFIKDRSIDLVCGQPPYANALKYTMSSKDDLSHIANVNKFCNEIQNVARELYRVLKKWKWCAILIGDIRRNRMIMPLGFKVLEQFLRVGFQLEDIIIKEQHRDRSSEFYFPDRKFLKFRIAHEYLFIFRKGRPKRRR